MEYEIMSMQDICLDTNTIISYLLLSEPEHNLIKQFISKNPNKNYYYTENIQKECEIVFNNKYNLIRSILLDFNKYLNLYHNEYCIVDDFIHQFVSTNNKTYLFKGKNLKKYEFEKILKVILFNINVNESIEGFKLQNYISEYLWRLNHEILVFKENFFKNLIFIIAHKHNYPHILKTLEENESHYADNMIILDLYEYHLNYDINFVLISFDKNFVEALKKCNFNFIEKILNLSQLN